MTPREVLNAGLALIADYTDRYPTAHAPMYRRINVRQRQLFTIASSWNTEYYGICAIGDVEDGACNLNTMEGALIYPIERIERIEINELAEESSVYDPGERLHIVTTHDIEANDIAPRATIRSGVVRGVGSDLDEVTKIEVYYSRRPHAISVTGEGPIEGENPIELEDPFQDLLVFDLGKDLLRRTVTMDSQVKAAAIEVITEVETELLSGFEAHVRMFSPVENRFS